MFNNGDVVINKKGELVLVLNAEFGNGLFFGLNENKLGEAFKNADFELKSAAIKE